MKKLILPFAIAVMLSGCAENSKNNLYSESVPVTKNSLLSYHEQGPMITSDGTDSMTEFELTHDIDSKISDSKISWKYFDGLYNSQLSDEIKQNLGYIILVKKDLIGLVKSNPDDAANVAGLKKYIDVLVDTRYLGYTALYHALNVLPASESAYVRQKAAEIGQYSNNDGFHEGVLAGGPGADSEVELFSRLGANYDMRLKIKELE